MVQAACSHLVIIFQLELKIWATIKVAAFIFQFTVAVTCFSVNLRWNVVKFNINQHIKTSSRSSRQHTMLVTVYGFIHVFIVPVCLCPFLYSVPVFFYFCVFMGLVA